MLYTAPQYRYLETLSFTAPLWTQRSPQHRRHITARVAQAPSTARWVDGAVRAPPTSRQALHANLKLGFCHALLQPWPPRAAGPCALSITLRVLQVAGQGQGSRRPRRRTPVHHTPSNCAYSAFITPQLGSVRYQNTPGLAAAPPWAAHPAPGAGSGATYEQRSQSVTSARAGERASHW